MIKIIVRIEFAEKDANMKKKAALRLKTKTAQSMCRLLSRFDQISSERVLIRCQQY